MRIILTLLFLIPLLVFGQVRDTLTVGEYAISTLGTNDYVNKIDVPTIITSKYGVLKADTVFYVASGEAIPDISGVDVNKTPAILFQRGSDRSEQITVSRNNVIYGSYGTGEKPKIYGSEVVTNFTVYSGNIYRAALDVTDVYQVFVDGARAQSARIPKTGYYDVTSVSSTTVFRSNQMPSEASNYYVGAIVFARNSAFTFEAREITASLDSSLTIASTFANSAMVVGEGYYLTNKLEFLTAANEWYYDATGNYLYLWVTDGDDPDNYEIRASTTDKVVDISDVNYITIKNLDVLHGNYGVFISNSDYVTVNNCSLTNQDKIGIGSDATNYTNPTFTYNSIIGVNGNAIRTKVADVVIRHNTISNTGLFANLQKESIAAVDNPVGTAIYTRENNNFIEYNHILNSGYNGIAFIGLNTMVKNNYIDGICQTLDDGAAIYAASTTEDKSTRTIGSVIQYNTILNAFGNPDGKPTPNNPAASGIYFDFEPKGILCYDNFIANASYGLFITGGGDNYIRRDTVINAMLGMVFDKDLTDANGLIYFRNNYIYASDTYGISSLNQNIPTRQRVMSYENEEEWYQNDSNTYVSAYVDGSRFRGVTDFAAWKTESSVDANSTYTENKLPIGYGSKVLANSTASTKTFYLNGATNVTDFFTDASITGNISIPAYSVKTVKGMSIDNIRDSVYTPPTYNYIDNLILAFDFEETAAPINEDSPNNWYLSSETDLTYNVTGNPGAAISLNGTTSRIGIADKDSLSFTLTPATWEFWVKPDVLTTSSTSDYIHHKSNEFSIYQLNDDLQVTINEVSTANVIRIYISDFFTVTDEFVQIIVTWDGSNNSSGIKLYKNGTFFSSANSGVTSIAGGANTANSWFVGGTTSQWWAGDISLIRVWNTEKTNEQVKDLYNYRGGRLTTDF